MLGLAGSMQRVVDVLRVGRTASLVQRPVRLSSVLVCGVVVFLCVGVGSAFAREGMSKAEEEYWLKQGVSFIRHAEAFKSGPEALRWCEGSECFWEPEFTLPAGEYDYLYRTDNIPVAYRLECTTTENGKGKETCTGGPPLVLPGFTLATYKTHGEYAMGNHYTTILGWAYRPYAGDETRRSEQLGSGSAAEPGRSGCFTEKPVNCATGNEVQTETDLSVGGRGPGLQLALTYNSLLAVKQATAGSFGFGWTGSYSAHLELTNEGQEATVYQDNGSTVTFTRSREEWNAPAGLVEATLANEGTGYVYTLPDQTKLHFNEAGQLTGEEDRNGNTVTLAYNTEKQLESETDGSGRKLTLKYNAEHQVESAEDPMKHVVKYTYESGNLASVTLPGEEKARWKYKYNTEHEMTSVTDGREHAITIEYNEAHQVKAQTDPMSRKRSWKYAALEAGTETTITEPNGATTVEKFNEFGSPTSVTHASGTSIAATATYEYNLADELKVATDPNKHVTEYGYDSEGNKTLEIDANKDERKWTYDTKHDIETETTPEGETTTIKRNAKGDPEVIERPAPGSTIQKTSYKSAGNGDVESMTDPLGNEWKYEYDTYGDRKTEIDPVGNKRTWEYNEDSQETATVSPRGNVKGNCSRRVGLGRIWRVCREVCVCGGCGGCRGAAEL